MSSTEITINYSPNSLAEVNPAQERATASHKAETGHYLHKVVETVVSRIQGEQLDFWWRASLWSAVTDQQGNVVIPRSPFTPPVSTFASETEYFVLRVGPVLFGIGLINNSLEKVIRHYLFYTMLPDSWKELSLFTDNKMTWKKIPEIVWRSFFPLAQGWAWTMGSEALIALELFGKTKLLNGSIGAGAANMLMGVLLRFFEELFQAIFKRISREKCFNDYKFSSDTFINILTNACGDLIGSGMWWFLLHSLHLTTGIRNALLPELEHYFGLNVGLIASAVLAILINGKIVSIGSNIVAFGTEIVTLTALTVVREVYRSLPCCLTEEKKSVQHDDESTALVSLDKSKKKTTVCCFGSLFGDSARKEKRSRKRLEQFKQMEQELHEVSIDHTQKSKEKKEEQSMCVIL